METIKEIDVGDVVLSCLVIGTGPLVIALHGFPDDRETFRPILPTLVMAGFQVVVPTLRGYCPSGIATSGVHHALMVGEDVLRLADKFSPNAPVRIVGHDWGAIAAFAATAIAPERFSHLVSLAVPHPRAMLRHLRTAAQLRKSWYMGLFQIPRVAEYVIMRQNFGFIDKLWADWSPSYRPTSEELALVKEGIRGREKEVLAYYRALRSLAVIKKIRPLMAKTQVPSIHVHGAEDGCVGLTCTKGAERHYSAGYSLHVIDGAGHFMTREKPTKVCEVVMPFLMSGR